jgi:hypothetical protein
LIKYVEYCGKVGHSALISLPWDGDGSDYISVKGNDSIEFDVDEKSDKDIVYVKTVDESAPPGNKAEEWIKANKEQFKKEYGDNYEEYLYGKAWSLFGAKEDLNTTAGIANIEPPLGVKTSDFAGYKCVHLSKDEYHKCVRGKVPFERWNKYITDESRCKAIKEVFYKNKRVAAKCEELSAFAFLKR